MNETKFLICKHCGNIVQMVRPSGVYIICCGEPMEELKANSNETASQEKHLPVLEIEGLHVKVKVGELPHPMLAEHYIQWIYLETEQGGQIKKLHPGDAPEAEFTLAGNDKLISVYEYCNLHGLFRTLNESVVKV